MKKKTIDVQSTIFLQLRIIFYNFDKTVPLFFGSLCFFLWVFQNKQETQFKRNISSKIATFFYKIQFGLELTSIQI